MCRSPDRSLHTERITSVLVLVHGMSRACRHLTARCFGCECLSGAAKFGATDLCPKQTAQEQLCLPVSRVVFWKQASDGAAALALIPLGGVLLLCPAPCCGSRAASSVWAALVLVSQGRLI